MQDGQGNDAAGGSRTMKYVYGPVPTRRLGQSLGIDPIPAKTCNWNCVYCQLGRTRPLQNIRKEYVPVRDVIREVEFALSQHAPGEIDWITIVGSGEPTLHESIGWLIRQVKILTDLPVAVITNGSLLFLPEVRRELCAADAVLPSLDAGTAELFSKINRPHPACPFANQIYGLAAFRDLYKGQLLLEVMLIKGLNDTEEALGEIASLLEYIRPDRIHLSHPNKPPAEYWIQPTDDIGMERARMILGDVAEVIPLSDGIYDLTGNEDALEAVIGIIIRHPMRQEEIEETLNHWIPGHEVEALEALESSGRVQVVKCGKERFWSASHSYYPGRSADHTPVTGC